MFRRDRDNQADTRPLGLTPDEAVDDIVEDIMGIFD